MTLKISSALASAVDAAATAAVDDAYVSALGSNSVLQIRTGEAPGLGSAATGTLLASATIANWTAATPTPGQLTGSDPAGVEIVASGDAGYFRIVTSGGTSVLEGTVGTSAADLVLDSVAFVQGGIFNAGAPVITVPVTAATE